MIIKINYYESSKWLLVVFIAFCFIGYTPFAIQKEFGNLGGGSNSSLVRQIVFISFWLMSAICFYKLGNIKLIKEEKLFLLLLFWCFISFIWSPVPIITIKRSILLLLNATTVFMLVSVLALDDVFDGLKKLFVFLIIASIFAIPIFPGAVHHVTEYGDVNLIGNWKGIFIHKNHAGYAAVFAIILFISDFIKNRNYWSILMIILSFVFLFFTRSKTSLLLLIPCLFRYAVCKHCISKDETGITNNIYRFTIYRVSFFKLHN
ncbi:hypothetical protein L3081_21365 [Colwellia sp. MSW7]|uniref:Uncharacterized protein n=1 Tax=Colwellia maritima TaxID=2912588 RepID=A0ABS9X6S9_9GAMM|nr:hypothetical protein [Colwellia maritima]MCI2285477.1 hypothetical protein [Colwellia maritima]